MDVESFQIMDAALDKAEEAQAMFGGIKAVLAAAESYTRHQLVQNQLGSGYKEQLNYIGGKLQDLLGVVEHLLLEMEQLQNELVDQLAEKTFSTREELEAASAAVNGTVGG